MNEAGYSHLQDADSWVLKHETRIQWVQGHHPEEFAGSYVREGVTYAPTRMLKPRLGHSGMVAYSVLGPEARSEFSNRLFKRRVWWRAPHDPYGDGTRYMGGPCEQVDPLTIRAGQRSRMPNWTKRAPAP